MVLMSFSDPDHVPRIWDGKKAQTTRKPRKNSIKVGDTLQVYFRSRMVKGTCKNCIVDKILPYYGRECAYDEDGNCVGWNNYFGTAKVTKIDHCDDIQSEKIIAWDLDVITAWAKADGFNSLQEADDWFTKVHGEYWRYLDWDIIYFKGDWLKEGI